MDRVAVAEGAEAGQHDVSTCSGHPLQSSTFELGLVTLLFNYLRCHVRPDFSNISLGRRVQQSSGSIVVARLWLRFSCVTERTSRCCYAAFMDSWISGPHSVGFMSQLGCCCHSFLYLSNIKNITTCTYALRICN